MYHNPLHNKVLFQCALRFYLVRGGRKEIAGIKEAGVDRVDTVVIGAGVIGLACARSLALAGRDVLILEHHGAIGCETSSRNSEVIHAGLYYPTGSLKARMCVAGRELLYAYCRERGIAHQRCGKLLVATREEQGQALESIRLQAEKNGVSDLTFLSGDELRAREPALAAECIAGLLSPSTGILDSHALMLSLLGEAEAAGATLALRSTVISLAWTGGGLELEVVESRSKDPVASVSDITRLHAQTVINATGLSAPRLAARLRAVSKDDNSRVQRALARVPDPAYAKGNYFSLVGKSPFSHLVYPVPEPGGLGIHLTLDLAGQARFGPDVEWLKGDIDIEDGVVVKPDYSVAQERSSVFYPAIRRYWPGLADNALQPAYSGVRPKLMGAVARECFGFDLGAGVNSDFSDFVIDTACQHGIPGLVHLYGIESPGLTSCLALADEVVEKCQ